MLSVSLSSPKKFLSYLFVNVYIFLLINRLFATLLTNELAFVVSDPIMTDEKKKIPDDLKKELLKKTEDDGFRGGIEAAKAKLEGKIPTKAKDD